MSEVSMDYEAVETMAAGFYDAADTLNTVGKALEAAIALLKATAFIGMVGNVALASYLEGIHPNVVRLAATCEELGTDLRGAVASLRDGDMSGSQRFVGASGGVGGGSLGPHSQPLPTGGPGVTSGGVGGGPHATPGSSPIGQPKPVPGQGAPGPSGPSGPVGPTGGGIHGPSGGG